MVGTARPGRGRLPTPNRGRGREGGEGVGNRNAVPDPEGGTMRKWVPFFGIWGDFFGGENSGVLE